MRHRKKTVKLNRNTKQRQALFKSQLRELILMGSLVTTVAKAKQLKRLMDKIVYRARVDSIANRRQLHRFFGKRQIVNTLVDRVAPTFKDKTGGFTSITKIGQRRGDNALLVKIAFVKTWPGLGNFKPLPPKKETKQKKRDTRSSKVKVVKKSKSAGKNQKTS